jgi:glycosyltransferase involved in cell wall biosynthesis
MIDNPLVSVCIPSYNTGPYIGRMLDSTVNQSYKNIEILISDNASTDNTEHVVKSFNDPRIHYHRHETHLGPEDSYNRCVALSSNGLMAVYHSDDVYDKRIVQSQVDFMAQHPDCGAVFALADKIDEKGRHIGDFPVPRRFKKGGIFYLYGILRTLLVYGYTPLITASVMLRRSVVDPSGLFNSKQYGKAADTEMWFRILKKYPVGILGQRLVHYRIRKSQGSNMYNYLRTTEADFLRVAEDYIGSNAFTEKQRFKLQTWLVYQRGIDNIHRSIAFYLNREYGLASELIKKSLNLNFFFKSFRTLRGLKYSIVAIAIYIAIVLRIHFFTFGIIKRLYRSRWA